ncbi:hypothetical protein DCAR_0935373 [Daucus carota subsp. sativus]|uniref:Uncharacterized protein n=1 Tax=Daucus carota subsp. sativus TaxID=79200 RepID=A0A175YI34_DAUCS|nr:hypothetical protein DCAR_0935373 [Daucus carota subsp. sativus]
MVLTKLQEKIEVQDMKDVLKIEREAIWSLRKVSDHGRSEVGSEENVEGRERLKRRDMYEVGLLGSVVLYTYLLTANTNGHIRHESLKKAINRSFSPKST